MDTLLLMVICFAGYLLAYHTYGKFLARKIFELSTTAEVPSRQFEDDIDFVPTKRGIIFGHHFTSIAGTGPIVGPAIGIIWGWVPAVLWIFFGSIFMGAVHDFGALIVSMRNEGKSISEIAARYINSRVRFIFFALVFLSLLIVIAIFGLVIAVVFKLFPESVLPVWLQIPIAMGLGFAVYKKKANILLATMVAVVCMYLTVALGAYLQEVRPGLLVMPDALGLKATGLWTIILLGYAWVASTMPVTMLLQPRDYINAWQLIVAMALLIVGIVVASTQGLLPLAAPAFNHQLPADTPPLWPFMFITIACGAISGFHSLVASGTSPKQVANEKDCLFVGYGSMLMEGILAILVIICVGAGIAMASEGSALAGTEAWYTHYGEWLGSKGLGDKLNAFILGAANITDTLSLPRTVGTAVMGVFVASFAGTTLDTSVRLQRYVVTELASDLKLRFLTNRWTATTFVVFTAAGLAFATGASGAGAMILWPLFGAANQTLAALALLIATLYLRKKGGLKYLTTGIPCVIMLVVTNYAMVVNEIKFIQAEKPSKLLIAIGAIIYLLALWMTVEALIVFSRSKQTPAETTSSQ